MHQMSFRWETQCQGFCFVFLLCLLYVLFYFEIMTNVSHLYLFVFPAPSGLPYSLSVGLVSRFKPFQPSQLLLSRVLCMTLAYVFGFIFCLALVCFFHSPYCMTYFMIVFPPAFCSALLVVLPH